MRTRKHVRWVLGGVVAVAAAMALPAAAAPRVIVNGQTVQGVRVYPMGGHMMVPVREVIERIPGAGLQWVPARREMIVSDPGRRVRVVLHTESGMGTEAGRDLPLNAPVVMRKGRALVPARFFEEVFGAQVDYDLTTQFVSISTGSERTRTAGYRKVAWLDSSPTGAVAIGGEPVISFLHPGTYSSVEERASRVTELLNDGITQIAPQRRGAFSANRVYLAEAGGDPVIMMGTIAVVRISPDDAEKHQTTQQALANEWLTRMRMALADVYGNAGASR